VLAWQWSGASRIAAPLNGDGKPPVLAELRGKLLAEDPEAVTVAWKKAGDDPAIVAGEADLESVGALGDVVWSSARQQGYMRFRGLAANDPNVAQYQLWIFDAERDEAYPVDGGVFDVPAAGGDVVVRIDPRLRVSRATAFAITVEKPGGVVVSSRKRLPLLAAVP
jgi:anti-sigma-K factor RskA